jgi:hypothetical protein
MTIRDRALRYLSVYAALLAVLAGSRFLTQHTYSDLQALVDREDALVYRKAQLTRELDGLESKARVREWATKNEMIPWSTAKRQFSRLEGLTALPPIPNLNPKVKVITQWR